MAIKPTSQQQETLIQLWFNVGNRLRRWPSNIKPTLGGRVMFPGIYHPLSSLSGYEYATTQYILNDICCMIISTGSASAYL